MNIRNDFISYSCYGICYDCKNIISKWFKDELKEQFESTEENIILPDTSINIRKNENLDFYYGIRNEYETKTNYKINIYCKHDDKNKNCDNIMFTKKIILEPNEVRGDSILINISDELTSDIYVFNFEVIDENDKITTQRFYLSVVD